MSNISEARKGLLDRILEGSGVASQADRRAAFDLSTTQGTSSVLADKVAKHANRINDSDIAAAKASGLSEDQIFEIAVCAAVGQANRQYNLAFEALEAATRKEQA